MNQTLVEQTPTTKLVMQPIHMQLYLNCYKQGRQHGTVGWYGTVRLKFCEEVRYAFFVMVLVRYVDTLIRYVFL